MAEMNEKAILQFQDLDISFRTNAGTVHAIRGVNLDLQRGETVAIVGESGSGKSVTVKACVGLLDANATVNSGKILYRYTDEKGAQQVVDLLTLPKRELRRTINGSKIAMVFQDPMTSLDPTMTIGKQVMEGILIHKKADKAAARARALELLELVGITDAERRMKAYPHQLSGGMRQRVVIAIALASDPEILICDEPTTALDVTIQARILELIKDVQKRLGISVIYITHDLGVVAKVADYVNVMYAGKIIEVGNVNEIFYEPKHPYTWGLLAAITSPWATLLRRATPSRSGSTRRPSLPCSRSATPTMRPPGSCIPTHPRSRCPPSWSPAWSVPGRRLRSTYE